VNNNNSNDLRTALQKLGAREYEVAALSMDVHRGLAAIAYAQEKGVDHPISYAIKIFDNPEWQPTNEKPRRATNVSVEVTCETCHGDRFIVHRTRSPEQSGWMKERGIEPNLDEDIEEYKPCPACNASVDAGFFRADGTRFVVAK
jgi:hypothetical protein